jgi:hypothetical protein
MGYAHLPSHGEGKRKERRKGRKKKIFFMQNIFLRTFY